MCGRFAFFAPADAIAAAFNIEPSQVFAPRYNIAPTQKVLTIVAGSDSQPTWQEQTWGLVPFWAKDPAIGNRMINARAETIAEKPSYRQPFSRRRCLVPASGFYEWRKGDDGKKTPYFISRADEQPLLMAGIWDVWEKGEGDALRTFSIITREANDFMRDLHHRMPVIMESAVMDVWFDAGTDKAALQAIISEPVTTELQAWAVSKKVNSPLNDQAELVAAV